MTNMEESPIQPKIKKTKDMQQYMKQYRKEHSEKWTEKVVCSECGNIYRKGSTYHHKNSKKHIYGVMAKKLEKYEQQIPIIQN